MRESSLEIFSDKVPPYCLEAEMGAIGSILIDKEAWWEVSKLLKPEDFYRQVHDTIYRAIQRVIAHNEPIDLYSVQEALKAMGLFDEVGRMNYVANLIQETPTSAHAGWYAAKVKEMSLRRQFIDLARRGMAAAYDLEQNISGIAVLLQDGSLALAAEGSTTDFAHIGGALIEAVEIMEDWNRNPRRVTGVPIGIMGLEYMTGGWQPSDFCIVAARPSQGKTAFLLQCAKVAATEGVPVGIISIEMGRHSLMVRLISHTSHVPMQDIRRGSKGDGDWTRLFDAVGKLDELPIYLDDSPSFHVRDLPIMVRRMKAEKNIGVVFLDYIQIMDVQKMGNRNEEVSYLARQCKTVARDTQIPIVAMAQLNRALEYRTDKEPILSDLRDSGQLEQEADLVIFIHNPKPVESDNERRQPRPAKFIIAKQRNGPTGPVRVVWDGEYQRFTETTTRYG